MTKGSRYVRKQTIVYSEDMTTAAGHCAERIAWSAGRDSSVSSSAVPYWRILLIGHNVAEPFLLRFVVIAVADLEGAEPAPPPPLDDELTPSLTVMLANANF